MRIPQRYQPLNDRRRVPSDRRDRSMAPSRGIAAVTTLIFAVLAARSAPGRAEREAMRVRQDAMGFTISVGLFQQPASRAMSSSVAVAIARNSRIAHQCSWASGRPTKTSAAMRFVAGPIPISSPLPASGCGGCHTVGTARPGREPHPTLSRFGLLTQRLCMVVAPGAEDGIYFSSAGLPGSGLALPIADDFAVGIAAASELSFATGVPLLAIPGGGRGVDEDPD
jgi:hypothetical protein